MITFDVISDLKLSSSDKFNWEDKATSLFCIIAGNISDDLKVIQKTLMYLSTMYNGIFYIDGGLEHLDPHLRNIRADELQKLCGSINNVVFLHNNIIILQGVALVGINGWYGNYEAHTLNDHMMIDTNRREDLTYLYHTLKRLQLHVDVKDIVIVSNSVPDQQLYFNEIEGFIDEISPTIALQADTEKKVKHWIFGTYTREVDTNLLGINFIANPKKEDANYYAKILRV